MKLLKTTSGSSNYCFCRFKHITFGKFAGAATLLLFLIIFTMPSVLPGAILTVKQDGTGDFTQIQEAYMATLSGDTVLVYPGTYIENLHIYKFIDITLTSLFLTTQDRSYINNTIIDGNQTGSCVYIQDTYDKEVTIEGFTLTNGSGHGEGLRGGGIYVNGASSVSVISNIIKNNTAGGGGGIMVNSSNLFISDNIICHNRAFGGGGGICNLYESNIEFDPIHKNSVYLNYAPLAMDISKIIYSGPMDIILDTCTVLEPDYYFIYSHDLLNFPNNDITISVEHGKIEPVNSDLYVNPGTGDDNNDGLTPETALRTVSWACTKIASDSTNPLNIYLMDGIYSPSTNQERFPFNGRSYVSLIGESMENTIFDGDSSYFFYLSSGVQTNFSIKNITMQNTYGLDLQSNKSGCMYFLCCDNATVQNITVKNCQDNKTSGIGFDYPDKLLLKNITIDHLQGGFVFRMGNTEAPGKTFRCDNIVIRDFIPDADPWQTGGEGGGMSVVGNLYEDDRFTGTFSNLQITNGLRIPNPGWGLGTNVVFGITYRAKVNLVNATIGNNTCRGVESIAGHINEGAVVNIYNTIMYGDSLKELGLGSEAGSYFPATANISYSNIEGGEDDIINWQNYHILNWLEGNMDENPQWVGTGDTAYYLQDDSPCINAGTPMFEEGMEPPYIKEENGRYVLYMHNMDTVHLPATDLAGNPRISGGRIDVGAYEFQDTTTAIQQYPAAQSDVSKVSVYPNPFYVHTFVDFSLEQKSQIRITIMDINGKTVKNLIDASLPKGKYKLTWKGDNDYGNTLKTGVYLLNMWMDSEKVSTLKVVKEKY